MFKKVEIICIVCILALLCGCSSSDSVDVETKDVSAQTTAEKDEKIMVYVCGEVKDPGVYELKSSDRIVVAVEAAGGLTSKASTTSVNQAEKVKDEQQIYIPSKKEESKVSSGQSSASGETDRAKVNINTASTEQLTSLSGIGESRAKDIISYREEHGSFSKIEDIMNVQGIKEGIYNKIKDSITT